MKHSKQVEINLQELQYKTLDEAIVLLNNTRAKIPVEFRHMARMEIDAVSDYDSYNVEIAVTYERPETDVECQERQQKDNFQKNKEIEYLKARLAKLI